MLDSLLCLLSLSLLAAPSPLAPSACQEKAPAAGAKAAAPLPTKPYHLDGRTEELVLPDLDGREHKLFAENEGQALLLVFWSYRDPVSRFYVPLLAELQEKHSGRLAVYLVDSNHDELVGAGDPLAKMREVLGKEKVTLPVLIDRENRLADDFQAKTNAQVFLLDANRYLRYHGGIDDDPKGEKRKASQAVTAKLVPALELVLAGKKPENNWTIPAGRPLKRAPKDGGAAPK